MRSDANSHGPVDVSGSPHARLQPLAAEIDGGVLGRAAAPEPRACCSSEGARKLEEAGNFHNLRVAAGQKDGEFLGMRFADSDVHKWLEALGWELAREPSEELAALADAATELVAAAQEPSGYLNSYFQVDQTAAERFVNLAWDHELYCAGHLIQAAVAHARGPATRGCWPSPAASPTTSASVFGPGRNEGTPGHPGDRDRARRALPPHRRAALPRARGLPRRHPRPRDAPARQVRLEPTSRTTCRCARRPRSTGHCVRALYLDAGVTDLHLETGEAALLDVLQAQWRDMTERKMYLTGGLGRAPHGRGVRRPLRAAARPLLRRDLRGDRVGALELADAAA